VSSVDVRCVAPDGTDLLLFDGPLVEVEITGPIPMLRFREKHGLTPFPVARGLALLDTGAAVSAVDVSVFNELEIPSVTSEIVRTAHGLSELDRYNASVRFTQLDNHSQPLDLVMGGHFGYELSDGRALIMLVGRDLLQRGELRYNGPNASFSFSL